MSGARRRGNRAEVVVRLTEQEAQQLEMRLVAMDGFERTFAKVKAARHRVVRKYQEYRAMPIEPMKAVR